MGHGCMAAKPFLRDIVPIAVGYADKNYTLTLADTLLPPDPQTGRDQSTISFEYDFTASNDCKGDTKPDEPQRVFIPWSSFRATFRGRDVDAPPIKTEAVRRISILIRR